MTDGVFSWTAFDRLKYGLSRLSFGIATWRGLDARKLAAGSSAAKRTAVVVSCRFPPPAAKGPHATQEWHEVRVRIGDVELRFEQYGNRKPRVVDVHPGTHRLRVEHDGPPPSFETDLDVDAGQTLLIEVRPATRWILFGTTTPRLRVRSGDDQLVAEHDL